MKKPLTTELSSMWATDRISAVSMVPIQRRGQVIVNSVVPYDLGKNRKVSLPPYG